jgi:hypothetical protein
LNPLHSYLICIKQWCLPEHAFYASHPTNTLFFQHPSTPLSICIVLESKSLICCFPLFYFGNNRYQSINHHDSFYVHDPLCSHIHIDRWVLTIMSIFKKWPIRWASNFSLLL